MMRTLVVLALGLAPQERPEADYYVAPGGDDAGPGTFERPFATLQRARDAVRTRRSGKPVTVYVRGGTYLLERTLVFGPEDSGTPEAPIVLAAYPGERPVLSGGLRLSGWRRGEINGRAVWTAEAPETLQLFVDGRRRPRARLPKEGFYTIAEVLDAGRGIDAGARRFRFAP
ncbi:MAG: PDZ domain-containing protein, partial [Planctomycetota bacterium]